MILDGRKKDKIRNQVLARFLTGALTKCPCMPVRAAAVPRVGVPVTVGVPDTVGVPVTATVGVPVTVTVGVPNLRLSTEIVKNGHKFTA